MKESLSSVDIAVIVKELQQLVGARVEKVYQIGKEEIRLKLHKSNVGSFDLIIEAGRRIHLTKYRREAPRMPSNFAMFLRKYLGGCRIIAIRQFDFDRIVELSLSCRDNELGLIAELLPGGNIILIDEKGEILIPFHRVSFSTREIKAHERYERPPSRINPLQMSKDEFAKLCSSATKDVVRTLAMCLGGLYAEEVCAKSGIDKHKHASALDDAELNAIYSTIREVLKPVITGEGLCPHIVIEAGEHVDVLPFELSRYKDAEKITFPSFNDAVDEFFTKKIADSVETAAQSERDRVIARYERILKEQEEALAEYQTKEEEWRRKGELIYTKYRQIEDMLASMTRNARKVELSLPEGKIEIDTSLSLFKNASLCYERAKVFKRKREGVERAIAETKERLKQAQERELAIAKGAIPEKREMKRKKQEWYERFRWFVTREGVLVIAGNDATTNEMLVKKYMDSDDLFCHTQTSGAPVVIAKTGGKTLSESSLRAIAQFAASYSSLWKYGFYEGECYIVSGEQVSKAPPSGEYIRKGSFVIRGKRQYFKVPLGLCIGIDERDRVVALPEQEKQRLKRFVVLEPDNELDKNELSTAIVEYFQAHGIVTTQDKILRLLPPGKSRIKAKSG